MAALPLRAVWFSIYNQMVSLGKVLWVPGAVDLNAFLCPMCVFFGFQQAEGTAGARGGGAGVGRAGSRRQEARNKVISVAAFG